MTTPHLVTFTPVGNFFFGGAVSFSDGFFVQSDRFPQPTTVLGALRAALLLGNGLLVQHKRGRFVPNIPEKKEKAVRLTGTARVNAFEENPDFGVIDRLTAPFLFRTEKSGKEKEAFFILPMDVAGPKDVAKAQKNGLRISGYTPMKAFSSNCGHLQETLLKSDFNGKEEKQGSFLADRECWRNYIAMETIQGEKIDVDGDGEDNPFLNRSQVGIGLERRRVVEGQFYVKNEYSFRKGCAFAVILWLKDPSVASTFARTITLGGDQSVFSLDVEPIDPNDPFYSDHPVLQSLLTGDTRFGNGASETGSRKAVALSPLVLREEDGIFDQTVHSVVPGIDNVRMLNSIIVPKAGQAFGDKQYRDGKKVIKSDAYRLVPAGSVFFLRENAAIGGEETEAVPAHVADLPGKIGYNRILYCKSRVTPQ